MSRVSTYTIIKKKKKIVVRDANEKRTDSDGILHYQRKEINIYHSKSSLDKDEIN